MKKLENNLGGLFLFFIVFMFSNPLSYAQEDITLTYKLKEQRIYSDIHNNKLNSVNQKSISGEKVAFYQRIELDSAKWFRLIFTEYNLGNKSYVSIRSLHDNQIQYLDSKSLKNWSSKSAAFNGNKFEVMLHVAENDENIYFKIDTIIFGGFKNSIDGVSSLCGADNRVAENNPRVGRLPVPRIYANDLGHCTVWLASNGAVLTAGHCVDWTLDGTLDLVAGDFVEFNIPPSAADGIITLAAVNDQYPIDIESVNFDATNVQGQDWAVFRCLPNGTGRSPHQSQNQFFRLTNETPVASTDNVRITGCGIDDDPNGPGPCYMAGGDCRFFNNTNATLQTNAGLYLGESSAGNRFWHTYTVDTEPANSGSPIIWEGNNGFSIGIHTFGGCTASGGFNGGTSLEHNPLENALQNFHGANTRYVDNISMSPIENGTIFSPFDTPQEGINSVPAGGNMYITTGTYNGNSGLSITQAINIIPPASGTVIINP